MGTFERLPDLDDPRYLHEIGWFLYQQVNKDAYEGGGYELYRTEHSAALLNEVLGYASESQEWLSDKTVVAIGSGCACELRAWPARVKIEVDPLLYAYQQLRMLLPDIAGAPTVRLATSAEETLLLDEFADIVVVRNALDHVEHPEVAIGELWRILKPNGHLFISVDLGGEPTPDEPSPFAEGQLERLLDGRFDIVKRSDGHKPHAGWRDSNSRLWCTRLGRKDPSLDRSSVLARYEDSIARS